MPYLIEAGVDVLHPIQTGCMSLEKTIEEYGDKISFLVGVDVQHLLPEGTPESVECGIENMINICYKPNGGLLVAAGNGIMPGTPIENILSLLKTLEKHK